MLDMIRDMLATARANGARIALIIAGLLVALSIVVVLFATGIAMNYLGYRQINYAIMILVMMVGSIALTALYLNHYTLPGNAPTAANTSRYFKNGLGDYLAWSAVVFGGLGLLSVQHHPWIIFPIIIVATIISFWYEDSIAKKLIRLVAVLIMVVSLGMLTLDTFGEKVFGYNPNPSKADQEIVSLRKAQEESKKVKTAQAMLMPEEERTSEQKELIREYGDPSLLGRAKAFLSSSDAEANEVKSEAPAPAAYYAAPPASIQTYVAPAPPEEKVVPSISRYSKVKYCYKGTWIRYDIYSQVLDGEDLEIHCQDGLVLAGPVDNCIYSGYWKWGGRRGTFQLDLTSGTGTMYTEAGTPTEMKII